MAVINKMYPLTLLALAASLAACGGGGGGGGGSNEPPRNTQQPPLTALPVFLQDQTQHCEFTENGQTVALVDYRGNLANVTALRCSGATLTSLQGIGELNGLLQASLPATGLTDLDELVAIGARLTHLNLAGNNITDLGQIGQFGALTHLDLSSNQLVNIAPLVDLLNLVELNLESNAITSVSALSALTQLTSLQLAGNAQLNCNDVFALANSLETVDSGTIVMPPAHCASALRLGDNSPASQTLNNSTESEPYGQIIVASGYSTGDLSMRQSGNNLVVMLATAAGPRSVTFTDWFVSTAHRVGSFTVSGQSYTFTQLRAQIGLGLQVPAGGAPFTGSSERDVIFGTEGKDHINGGNGVDTLIGGKGDDVLAGQSVSFNDAGIPVISLNYSNDTYIYDQGDGNDIIYQYGNFQGLLHFRNSITPDDITLYRSGDNLVFNMTGDNSVTIYNWFYNSAYRIGQLQFGNNEPVYASTFVEARLTP